MYFTGTFKSVSHKIFLNLKFKKLSILKFSSIKDNDLDGLNYMNGLFTLLKLPINGLYGFEVMTHLRILVVN